MVQFGIHLDSDDDEEDRLSDSAPVVRSKRRPAASLGSHDGHGHGSSDDERDAVDEDDEGEEGEEEDEDEDEDEEMDSDGPPPRGSLVYSDQSSVDGDGTDTTTRNRRLSHRSSTLSLSLSSDSDSASRAPSPHRPRQVPTRRDARSVSRAPSTVHAGPTPWPKALHLEPKRVAVMQASLFQPAPASTPKDRPDTRASPAPSLVPRPPPPNRHPRPSPLPPPVTRLPDPVIDPLPFRPVRKYARVPLAASITSGHEATLIDPCLSLGRSFRVGWGPHGQLVRLGPASEGDVLRVDRFDHIASPSPPPASAQSTNALTLATLQLQLSHTPIYVDADSSIPFAVPHPLLRFAHFLALFPTTPTSPVADAEHHLWSLGHALFDEIDDSDLPPSLSPTARARLEQLKRRRAFEHWLEDAVRPSVEAELRTLSRAPKDSDEAAGFERVFALLSGHQVARACEAALASRNVHLATLVAQAGGDTAFRQDLFLQLAKFREYRVDAHVPQPYRRVLELLCGNTGVVPGAERRDAGTALDAFRVCDGLDWKRALGVEVWYGDWEGSLEDAVVRYEKAFQDPSQGVAFPSPPYLSASSTPTDHRTDPLYQLIKLFASPTHPLESVLLPTHFGPSKVDYRLPWHLYILFSRVLRKRDFEDRIDVADDVRMDLADDASDDADGDGVEGNSVRADGVTEAFAQQLEAIDADGDGTEPGWVWSAFVLLHLELPEHRKSAIEALLSRHVAAITPDMLTFLTTTLKIPAAWVYAARATFAKYHHRVWDEFSNLLWADLRTPAHRLAVELLAPELVVREDFITLREKVLGPLVRPGAAKPDGWDDGGKIFLDYIDLVDELKRRSRTGAQQRPLASADAATLLRLLRAVPRLIEQLGGKPGGPHLLDVCLAEMQSRLVVFSSSLGLHTEEARAATMQEADKLVCLQTANEAFWTAALEEAEAGR